MIPFSWPLRAILLIVVTLWALATYWVGKKQSTIGAAFATAILALLLALALSDCASPAASPTPQPVERASLRDMGEAASQAAWEADHCDHSLTTSQCHALGDLRTAALRHSRAELDAIAAKNRWCFEMLMDGRLGDEQRREIQHECEPKLPPRQ